MENELEEGELLYEEHTPEEEAPEAEPETDYADGEQDYADGQEPQYIDPDAYARAYDAPPNPYLQQQQEQQAEAQIAQQMQSMSAQDRDAFVSLYNQWKSQGYSAKQISLALAAQADDGVREYLQSRAQKSVEDEMPVFASVDEEIKWLAEKAAEAKTRELREEVERMKYERESEKYQQQINALAVANENTFAEALSAVNMTPDKLTQLDMQAMSSAIQELYPGTNPMHVRFTKTQARAIVGRATEIAGAWVTQIAGRQPQAAPQQYYEQEQPRPRTRNTPPPPPIAGGRTASGRSGVSAAVDTGRMSAEEHQSLLNAL